MLKELLFTSLLAILLSLAVYFVLLASKQMSSLLEESKKKVVIKDNEIVSRLFDIASDTIERLAKATVGKIEQTSAKDLRELVKNGYANKEDLYKLAEQAYQEILESVAPETISDLEKHIKNSELYIKNLIEKEVLNLKKDTIINLYDNY